MPESFADSPCPLETFLHIQTWHSKYPTSGCHSALEFNVSFAGVTGIAFNLSALSQHRWNAYTYWSPSIAQTDLLSVCGVRLVVESTLQAMGLDHTRLPVRCDPDYRHTASSEDDAAARAHALCMRATTSEDAPLQLGAGQPQHGSTNNTQVFRCTTAASLCSAPTRTGYSVADQSLLIQPGRVYQTPPTPADKPYRITIPAEQQLAVPSSLWNRTSKASLQVNGMCGTSVKRSGQTCSSSTHYQQ